MRAAVVLDRPLEHADEAALLELLLLCIRFNTLPRAGGVLDQDSFYVELLSHTLLWLRERDVIEQQRGSSANIN